MVRIKTKNLDISYSNPWIEISDIPPGLKKFCRWLVTPHRRLKSRIRRYYNASIKWQGGIKWLTGLSIGVLIGIPLGFLLLFYIKYIYK